ncbi:MAG TPA: DUF3237 domain-containing protein [Mucilaginibacter sp.]|nr:DUF3237 domain-containing protein [Mucilaginibacter sp.]
MKKIILLCSCFLACIFLPATLSAQQISAEEIFVLNADLIRPPVVAGTKVIYSVSGGSVTGKIKGSVLPIGGDFATFINPTTLKLDVRLVLRTDDSATIYCTYTGYLHTDEETFKTIKVGKGSQIDPSRYYFRTNPIFETTSAKYDWLNHTITVGFGTITAAGVSYKIYAVK